MFLGLVTSKIRMLDANKMYAIFYSKLKNAISRVEAKPYYPQV